MQLYNKRAGITFNMMNMIPRFIFMIFVLITFTMTLNVLLRPDPETQYLEMDLFAFNLLNSPYGISYFDPQLNKVRPGIINLEDLQTNFTEEKINNGFYIIGENRYIASRISLIDQDTRPLKTLYYNRGLGTAYGFEYWAPVAIRSGKGMPKYHIRSMPVLILEDPSKPSKLFPGTIVFEVVMP